jgi:hypothetical protein
MPTPLERISRTTCNPRKERAFHERLLAAADKAGIPAKERQVRKFIGKDQFVKAAQLRNEILADMRRLVSQISQELSCVSS